MLQGLIRRLIRVGRLSIVYPGGRVEEYGDGSGPPVTVRLTARGVRRLMRDPDLGLGEAWMEGDLELEQGAMWDLLEMVGRNRAGAPARPGAVMRVVHALERRLEQWNTRAASRRNVHVHYDLSTDLYRRFLDADMQYSCAYFTRPDMSLEEAQAAKKAHLAAKLDLSPGQRVLDIGSGWGGLGLELAGRYGAKVTGVTLSEEQLAVARSQAEAAGLAACARFELTDYRDVVGPFDRIVSVGMFEHVGAPNYRAFFQRIADLLTDDGVAVIHSIGRRSPPGITQSFIRKYIFPGGYIPALSEVTAAVEEAGLWITDIEVLRLHYAETLRCWRMRFLAQREAIAELYDERFCRMWEFYLGVSELAFRYLDCMVFQVQLSKRVDALPLTRDYIHEVELAPPARRRA